MPATDRDRAPRRRRRPAEDAEVAEALAELKEWPLGFARSRKGNLWRRLDDTATLTVFPGRYGGYAWVLKEDDAPSPEYSPDAYTTERKAVEAAWWLLRGRYT